jgi:hypothetical protein
MHQWHCYLADFLGLRLNWVLVYGIVGATCSIQELVEQWEAQSILDDGILQSSRIPYCDETGKIQQKMQNHI